MITRIRNKISKRVMKDIDLNNSKNLISSNQQFLKSKSKN